MNHSIEITRGDYIWKVEKAIPQPEVEKARENTVCREEPKDLFVTRDIPPQSSILSDLGQKIITTVYKKNISEDYSSETGADCRFTPTCSLYMKEALDAHGFRKGLKMGLMRLSRCAYGVPGGSDPVPDRDGRYPSDIHPTHLDMIPPTGEQILSDTYVYEKYCAHIGAIKSSGSRLRNSLQKAVLALNNETTHPGKLHDTLKGFTESCRLLGDSIRSAEADMDSFPTTLEPELDFDHVQGTKRGAVIFKKTADLIEEFYEKEGSAADIRDNREIVDILNAAARSLNILKHPESESETLDTPGPVRNLLLKTIPPVIGVWAQVKSLILGAVIGAEVGCAAGAVIGYHAGKCDLDSLNKSVIENYSPASLAQISLYEHKVGRIPYKVNSYIKEHMHNDTLANFLGAVTGCTVSTVLGAITLASALAPMIGTMGKLATQNFVRKLIDVKHFSPAERVDDSAPQKEEKEWNVTIFQAKGRGLSKTYNDQLEKYNGEEVSPKAHIHIRSDVKGVIEDYELQDKGLKVVHRGKGDILSHESIRECLHESIRRNPARHHYIAFSGHTGRIAESLPEIRSALEDVIKETGISIDVIMLDSCKSAGIEALNELKDVSRYIVGSQEVLRTERPVMEALKKLPDVNPSVEEFIEALATTSPDLSMTVLSTRQLSPLIPLIRTLSQQILAVEKRADRALLREIVKESLHFNAKKTGDHMLYADDEVDLADFCRNLCENETIGDRYPELALAGKELHAALTNVSTTPVYLNCTLQNTVSEKDGYKHIDLKNADGISITIPTGRKLLGRSPYDSDGLQFYQATGWDKAIHHLNKGLNPFRFASSICGSVISSSLQALDSSMDMLYRFSPAAFSSASKLIHKVVKPAS